MTSADWADWAQVVSAAGVLLAVVVSLWTYFHQTHLTLERERHADVATLLSLQNLANELRQMNVLAGYQIDAPGNEVIYPDISMEFTAISSLLEKLPVERIALLGKMQTLLHLRRVAAELSMLYSSKPQPGANFYFQNRERLQKLEKACGEHARQLMADIHKLDPKVYETNQREIERL
jgi:hypothetical protein